MSFKSVITGKLKVGYQKNKKNNRKKGEKEGMLEINKVILLEL